MSSSVKKTSKEILSLMNSPPEGIRIDFSEEDMNLISAYINGPEATPYEDGIFHVKINITKEYPILPPKCHFVTKIFHPNVGKNGEICVNTLKKDWKKEYGISHVLLTIKCLLVAPNPESALNEEAGKLLLEAYETFSQRAKLMTQIHADKKKTIDQNVAPDSPKRSATDFEQKKVEANKKRSLKRL